MIIEKLTKVIHPFTLNTDAYPSEDNAVLIYFLGCTHGCVDCNKENLQDSNYTSKYTKTFPMKRFYTKVKEACEDNNTSKVIFSGGDPLSRVNRDFTREFLSNYKKDFDVCIYTGYDIDYVKKIGISNFEFVKCGLYEVDKKQGVCKTDEYIQLASTNQTLYNSNFELLSEDGIYNFS